MIVVLVKRFGCVGCVVLHLELVVAGLLVDYMLVLLLVLIVT